MRYGLIHEVRDLLDGSDPSPYDSSTIAVIGAGIAGVTTAYSLARRGFKVDVIDREPYPAMMTSYANGGQFSVSNSDTWCTWRNVGKGLRWMLRSDAPLLVRPLPTLSKMRWMAGFLWNTANGSWERNTRATMRLALQARRLYEDIARNEDIRFDHSKRGILHIYKHASSFEVAKRLTALYQEEGVDRRLVTPEDIRSLEPSLDTRGIIGGTYTPDDGMGDIHMFCANLAKVLRDKHGVRFLHGIDITGITDVDGGLLLTMGHQGRERALRYGQVVICAGADSGRFGWMVGDRVCVHPVKGYSVTIPLDDPSLAPITSLLDDDAKIVTSTLGARLRVAGTAELDGWNRDIRMERIDPLLRWVRTNLPHISTEHAIPWAGLRPMTPSMMPIVRQSKGNDRVWWNTGHGHLGWTLGAATAEIIAECIAATE